MAFINIKHVDTNFTAWYIQEQNSRSGDDIKCPVCHNDFLVGADEDLPRGWPCLFHVPRVFSKDEEAIEKDELTCPFLLKPLVLPRDYAAPYYKGHPLAMFFEDFLVDDNLGYTWIAPEKFLQESVKQYNRMLKLNNTVCRYCKNTYKLTYKAEKRTDKLSCSFGCDLACTYERGAADLSRLSLQFMNEWARVTAVHNKRLDFLDSIISRMPEGSFAE